MLIIKRKKGQRVYIGDMFVTFLDYQEDDGAVHLEIGIHKCKATVSLLGVSQGVLRLGFEAPQEVIIRREELPVTFKTKKGSDK